MAFSFSLKLSQPILSMSSLRYIREPPFSFRVSALRPGLTSRVSLPDVSPSSDADELPFHPPNNAIFFLNRRDFLLLHPGDLSC